MKTAGAPRRKPLLEYEEPDYMLKSKSKQLAQMIRDSRKTIVYTGAGISTAAEIPDYRGPNGVYTLATQGREIKGCADMTEAEPTLTHMILKELYRKGKVHHILSQNCDGLHLRSGLPQKALSEIHGNMYIEVCTTCDPAKQHIRTFDVTFKSAFKRHQTGRFCADCSTELIDTIVHFGELGKLEWPLNWIGTTSKVEKADLIICIGTSLNVLKSYRFLWPDQNSDTELVIINLQPTPKDNVASLKIHGKSDEVLKKVAEYLKIEPGAYCRACDPVLHPELRIEQKGVISGMSECSCHLRSPMNGDDKQEPLNQEPECSNRISQPGWWAAGIKRIKRKSGVGASLSEETHTGRRKSARIAATAPPPKKVGRPRKRPFAETLFEKDIREAMLSLLEFIDPILKKGRGRPGKGHYSTPFEKEGSFKFAFEKENEVVEVQKEDEEKVKHDELDSEDDAEEMPSSSSSSDEETFDPSFRVPKQQMLRLAMRPGNISPRRRCSIDQRKDEVQVKLEIEDDEPSECVDAQSISAVLAEPCSSNMSVDTGIPAEQLIRKEVKEELVGQREPQPLPSSLNAVDLLPSEDIKPPSKICPPKQRAKSEEPDRSSLKESYSTELEQPSSSNGLMGVELRAEPGRFNPEMERFTQLGFPRKRSRPFYERPNLEPVQINKNTSLGLILKMSMGQYRDEGREISAKLSATDSNEYAVAGYVRESRCNNQQNTQLKQYLEKSLKPFSQLTGTLATTKDSKVSVSNSPTAVRSNEPFQAITDKHFHPKRQAPLADVLMRNLEEIRQDFERTPTDEEVMDLTTPDEPAYHIKLPPHIMAKLRQMVIEKGGSQQAISGFLMENVTDPSLMNVTIKDLMHIAARYKRTPVLRRGRLSPQIFDKIKKECDNESSQNLEIIQKECDSGST